jgi:hypothetical protein
MPAPKDTDQELSLLFQGMGMALTRWQGVEDAHYLLFLKMLGAPKEEICSVLYFSPPTFESRRVLVDRVAHYFLEDKAQKKEWSDLNKRLGDRASERGRIAHYSLSFDFKYRGPTLAHGVDVTNPHIRPSPHNKVAVLQGKTVESPKHRLTADEVLKYIESFTALERDVIAFTKKISLPQPQQGLGLLSFLERPLDSRTQARQTLAGGYPNSDPTEKPPSDQ